MIRRACSWWFVTLLLAVPACTPARAAAQAAPAVTLDATSLDAYLAREVAARGLVGVSVAVVREGALIYAGAAGSRSLEAGARVDADTIFPVGSVTKQFVCAAALMLAEEGKLRITDPVAKWFPGLTRASDVTILDLMAHTSGYADFYPFSHAGRELLRRISPDELIHRWATKPLDFEPGSAFNYTNTGYIVLGEIISKASGEPIGSFLSRRIFGPAGMTRTRFDPDPPALANLASGYTTWAMSDPVPAVREAHGWAGAAGGIYSTASDLARWDLALMEGRLLRPDSYRVLTTARTLSNGQKTGYGCGLWVGTRGSQPTLSHGGGVQGFSSFNVLFPDRRSAVVFLTNIHPATGGAALYEPIMEALVPAGVPPAALVPPAPAAAAVSPVAAATPGEAIGRFYLQLLRARVDRRGISEDFSAFLTEAWVRRAAARLAAYGEPAKVEVDGVSVAAGLETARATVICPGGALKASLIRSMDGTVQQFTIRKQ